jgi:glutamine amidotransferase/cyclase
VPASEPGPNGEEWCWWQCTVKGGREARDIDAVAVAKAVEALGAGEIMLNCINNDGKGQVRAPPLTSLPCCAPFCARRPCARCAGCRGWR